MGWLADIINKTQQSPLKDRLNFGNQKYHDIKIERDNLQVKVDVLTAKNDELMQIANLDPKQHDNRLSDEEIEILQKIANENESSPREIAGALNINLARAEYHLARLVEKAYLVDTITLGYHEYLLDTRGRDYLEEHEPLRRAQVHQETPNPVS